MIRVEFATGTAYEVPGDTWSVEGDVLSVFSHDLRVASYRTWIAVYYVDQPTVAPPQPRRRTETK